LYGPTKSTSIENCWAKDYIVACESSGIISGYADGQFRPSNYATRAEVGKIIDNMLGLKK
jgi:hypothetical protein